MSALYALHKLVVALSPAERQLCQNYLAAFDSRGEKFESKSRKLFQLLCAGNTPVERELEFLLYGEKNKVAFSRLQLRLRDKLLEAVTLPANTHYHSQLTPYEKAKAGCRSKLMQAEFLISKGLHEMAHWLLTTLCETAAHYEFFAEWAQALELMPRTKQKVPASYARQLEKVQKQLQFCLVCAKLLHYAQLAPTGASPEEIAALRTQHTAINSARADFMLLEIEAITASKTGNYKQAVLCRRKQLRLITHTEALQNGEKLRSTVLQLMQNYLRCGWIMPALHLAQSHSQTPGWSIAQKTTLLQTETRIHLMTGNHTAAKRALHNLLPLDAGNQTLYLRAVHHYQQKDYEQTTACIEQLNWKQLGKEAHGANVLLFAAMVVVERFTGKALRKELGYLIHRLPLIEQVNEREKLCIELFEQLVQAEMNFLDVYKVQLGMLDQLRVKDGALAWNAYSGEIIAFHEWVIGKALKVAVKPVFSATPQRKN